MKKESLTLILLFAALGATAQSNSRRFSALTTFGSGISINSPGCTPFDWRVTGYWHPSSRWGIGAGTGVSVYEKALVPLYGQVRYSLTRPRRFTPFIACSAGYAFAPARRALGGLLLSPTLGTTFPAGGRLRLQFSMSCEMQKLQRVKSHTGRSFGVQFQESLNHSTLMFRLGLPF